MTTLAERLAAMERWSAPAPRSEDVVLAPGAISWDNWSEFFSGPARVAGVAVTPASAMRVAAVYACIRILAGVIGSLPCPIFERTDESRKSIKHALWWLLNEQPCESLTTVSFWEYVLGCMFLYGDGFAVIRRNGYNEIDALVPVDSRDVTVRKTRVGRFRHETLYAVQDGSETYGVPARDMLHFANLGFNGERSLSTIEYAARNAVGIAIAADEHSANTLAAGMTSRVVLEAPTGSRFEQEQVEQMRRQWIERYGVNMNGTPNSALPIILSNGLQAKPLTINPTDAQLLESRRFQVTDIARAFGVPPFMIGETEKSTSWGSGLEQQVLGFVKFTLQPHLRRIEQEINRKVWPVREKYFAEFNVNGLLRGDAKSRSDFYRAALGGAQGDGWITVDEVRKLENLPPSNEAPGELYKATRGSNEQPGNAPPAGAGEGERDPVDPPVPDDAE